MRIDVLSLPNSERPSGKRNSTINDQGINGIGPWNLL